jgi:hypothetical protein
VNNQVSHSAIRNPNSAFDHPPRHCQLKFSVSSQRFTTLAHSCNSPGGIFATFLKIFFPTHKPLINKGFAVRLESKDLKNRIFKIHSLFALRENVTLYS